MEDKPTYEELERRIRELTALSHEKDLAGKITRTLFDISNAVNTTHDIDDLYRSIYYSLNRLMNLKNFFIAIHSETDDTLRVPFYVDEMDIDVLDSRPLPKKNSLTGEVFLKGEPLFLTQKMLKKRAAENRIIGTPPKIWLGIPLKRDRKVLGIIATQSYDDPKYFSKRDLDILTMVSHQIATVIDKKHSQNQLDQLRNYLYNIINSMPSVLVVVDKQGKITQWNLQAELETGVNADQALGKTVETVFPRLAEHMDQVQDAIQSRKIKTRLKQKYQSNGKIRFEDIIIYPLISPGDKGKNIVDGVVIRVDDITDQAAMEEMMIQSEKMMSVGGLAAGMAHEINNPLAGMMQNAQVIYNRLSKDIPANQTAAEETGITLKNIRDYCEKRQILEKLDMINKTGIRS
ncbi:MAG: GAF domain-containing protein, partial [Desulfobacteraceae bacterium]|nr:GAF domain-containing protein [Desulfobacteraceae bacterium]